MLRLRDCLSAGRLLRVKLKDEPFISGSSSQPEVTGSGLTGDASHLPED